MVAMDNGHPVKNEDEDAPPREVEQHQEPVRVQSISPATQGLPCYFQIFIYPLSDVV